MKDRLKSYLLVVTLITLMIYGASEYLSGKTDEEVELYNYHVSILFNAHEILYHLIGMQEDLYRLEYGTFVDPELIKVHILHYEQGVEGLTKGINYIFLAGRDDEAFRDYANTAEAVQKLYAQFIIYINGLLSAKDPQERKKNIEEAIEIGERMRYFLKLLDDRMDQEYAEISTFLPSITVNMRWIRNFTGILFWCSIVLLSIVYFYSCRTFSRILPYLNAMRSGNFDYKLQSKNTLCEREIEATFNTVISKMNESTKSSSELSIIDPLTGAFNRRYFEMRINEEMSRYTRHGTIFSLSIIDIDHFKKINDTLGHQTGDSVLKETVDVIKNCVRDTDIVTRYGGEEFAIISPYTPKSGVLTLVERLRLSVEGYHFTGLSRPLTISIGVSDSAGKSTPEQIIEEADASLYIAKNSGRNKCVVGGITAQQIT